MDETMVAPLREVTAPVEDQQVVPALVTLGDENVPVCEDGSCAL
jgi:hypothetical protein